MLFERIEDLRAALASRSEAPAAAGAALAVASGPTLNKKDLNKLLNDFARACTFGGDLLARMAASKAIHEYLDSAFAALAATPAPEAVISTEDSLRTRLRWSQEKVEQLEEENRTLRGRLPGPNLDDMLKAAQPIEREDGK